MEESLLKAPIVDLLFGTIGLIVGLSVAFLVSFRVRKYCNYRSLTLLLPVLLSIILGILGFQVGFKKRDEITASCLLHQRIDRSRRKKMEEDYSSPTVSII